jgi:hypothetical protein
MYALPSGLQICGLDAQPEAGVDQSLALWTLILIGSLKTRPAAS